MHTILCQMVSFCDLCFILATDFSNNISKAHKCLVGSLKVTRTATWQENDNTHHFQQQPGALKGNVIRYFTLEVGCTFPESLCVRICFLNHLINRSVRIYGDSVHLCALHSLKAVGSPQLENISRCFRE